MSRANEERYVFETEWFDIQASLIRKYLFTFYPTDNTIEMVRWMLDNDWKLKLF